jgi:hypothetical protein
MVMASWSYEISIVNLSDTAKCTPCIVLYPYRKCRTDIQLVRQSCVAAALATGVYLRHNRDQALCVPDLKQRRRTAASVS